MASGAPTPQHEGEVHGEVVDDGDSHSLESSSVKPRTYSSYKGDQLESLLMQTGALFDGGAALDVSIVKKRAIVGGVPSLPHVAVMMAARPEVRAMGIRDMARAFHDFWEITGQQPDYLATTKQQFVWTAAATMNHAGTLFADPDAFIASVSKTAKIDLHIKIPTFKELEPILEGDPTASQFKAAQSKVLKWMEALGAPNSILFGGRKSGERLVASLRRAAWPKASK